MHPPETPAETLADEPASHRFASQGLSLHYVDWGNADAPTLVLLHGTRDHARSWDWTARALRHRFHVVALDLRGHGDSDWSPDGAYGSQYHLLDFADLIDRLGAASVSIVGHSYGGGVANRYAGMYPERVAKLVNVDGMGPSGAAFEQWRTEGYVARMRAWVTQRRDPRYARKTRFATLDEAVARMADANPHLSAEQARHLAVHGVRLHADGYGWKFDPMVSVFAPEDFAIHGADFWREATAPALILHGLESWAGDPEADGRSAHFADQRTIGFEHAGHWLHHDQFARFIGELEAFL